MPYEDCTTSKCTTPAQWRAAHAARTDSLNRLSQAHVRAAAAAAAPKEAAKREALEAYVEAYRHDKFSPEVLAKWALPRPLRPVITEFAQAHPGRFIYRGPADKTPAQYNQAEKTHAALVASYEAAKAAHAADQRTALTSYEADLASWNEIQRLVDSAASDAATEFTRLSVPPPTASQQPSTKGLAYASFDEAGSAAPDPSVDRHILAQREIIHREAVAKAARLAAYDAELFKSKTKDKTWPVYEPINLASSAASAPLALSAAAAAPIAAQLESAPLPAPLPAPLALSAAAAPIAAQTAPSAAAPSIQGFAYIPPSSWSPQPQLRGCNFFASKKETLAHFENVGGKDNAAKKAGDQVWDAYSQAKDQSRAKYAELCFPSMLQWFSQGLFPKLAFLPPSQLFSVGVLVPVRDWTPDMYLLLSNVSNNILQSRLQHLHDAIEANGGYPTALLPHFNLQLSLTLSATRAAVSFSSQLQAANAVVQETGFQNMCATRALTAAEERIKALEEQLAAQQAAFASSASALPSAAQPPSALPDADFFLSPSFAPSASPGSSFSLPGQLTLFPAPLAPLAPVPAPSAFPPPPGWTEYMGILEDGRTVYYHYNPVTGESAWP